MGTTTPNALFHNYFLGLLTKNTKQGHNGKMTKHRSRWAFTVVSKPPSRRDPTDRHQDYQFLIRQLGRYDEVGFLLFLFTENY